MAALFFGKPGLRLNISQLMVPLPFHGRRSERLKYIQEMKAKYEIEHLIRHNHRQTSVGPEQYRAIPHWVIPMYRAPGAMSPYYNLLINEMSDDKKEESDKYEEAPEELLARAEAYAANTDPGFDLESKADSTPISLEELAEIKKTLAKLDRKEGKSK